jgi:hypothetical protein
MRPVSARQTGSDSESGLSVMQLTESLPTVSQNSVADLEIQ